MSLRVDTNIDGNQQLMKRSVGGATPSHKPNLSHEFPHTPEEGGCQDRGEGRGGNAGLVAYLHGEWLSLGYCESSCISYTYIQLTRPTETFPCHFVQILWAVAAGTNTLAPEI